MDAMRTSGLMRDVAPKATKGGESVRLLAVAPEPLGEKFASKLAELKAIGRGKPEAGSDKPKVGGGLQTELRGVAKLGARKEEDRREGQGSESLSPATPPRLAPPTEPAGRIVAPVNRPTIEAAIERMAAAIAESRDLGATNVMRVDFPQELANGLATGAVVARDAVTGALSIRVVASGALLSDGRRSNLEDELRRNLERRRLRITAVRIDGPRAG